MNNIFNLFKSFNSDEKEEENPNAEVKLTVLSTSKTEVDLNEMIKKTSNDEQDLNSLNLLINSIIAEYKPSLSLTSLDRNFHR